MITSVLFYILATATLLAILMCITRRNPVHAVIYLVNGLFDIALIFYLLGAPLVAAWELIIYAGAIMVLFLFIIMMLELAPTTETEGPGWQRWVPVLLLAAVLLGCTLIIIFTDPTGSVGSYHASPREFGLVLFRDYGLAVEVVSFQLMFAAVGAFYVGKSDWKRRSRSAGRVK